MRVGMVGTAAGEPSVAVGREGGWVPLLTVPGADRLGPVSADLLAFLGAGEQVRELAEELVSAAPPASSRRCWLRRSVRWRFVTARSGRST